VVSFVAISRPNTRSKADYSVAPPSIATGFSRLVVIGHSNGGMLAVKHVSDHPDTPALVLLSAHGGGRDGVQQTSRAGMLAGARTLVAAGRGREPSASCAIRPQTIFHQVRLLGRLNVQFPFPKSG
jgi:pimeloyl-ACP methyl ester carboxylesterase